MKMTPAFIVASLVCAAPFALAVHQDLNRKDRGHHDPFGEDEDDDDDDGYGSREAHRAEIDLDQLDRDTSDEPYVSRDVEPTDLGQLLGTEPATLSAELSSLQVGASSLNFQSDAVRTRIEEIKEHKAVSVDFDFDDVSLNAIDLTIEGDETELRAALVDRWRTPRRGGEDELVWLGPDQTRAVYSARYDGFKLRFEKYATIEELIAPADKAKLGFEPYPIVGGQYAKLEAALGPKLQSSDDYDGEATIALPGIGAGAGRTMVQVASDDRGVITTLSIEGATYDGDQVREALIQKWGKPKTDGDTLEWRKNGISISAQFFDQGFTLVERK